MKIVKGEYTWMDGKVVDAMGAVIKDVKVGEGDVGWEKY